MLINYSIRPLNRRLQKLDRLTASETELETLLLHSYLLQPRVLHLNIFKHQTSGRNSEE